MINPTITIDVRLHARSHTSTCGDVKFSMHLKNMLRYDIH